MGVNKLPIQSWFPTQIYSEPLQKNGKAVQKLNEQILREVYDIRDLDTAGKRWCRENYPNGFTSYASVNDLHRRSTTFEQLTKKIDEHVGDFVRALELDLGEKANHEYLLGEYHGEEFLPWHAYSSLISDQRHLLCFHA